MFSNDLVDLFLLVQTIIQNFLGYGLTVTELLLFLFERSVNVTVHPVLQSIELLLDLPDGCVCLVFKQCFHGIHAGTCILHRLGLVECVSLLQERFVGGYE